jgi:hypothetical protein
MAPGVHPTGPAGAFSFGGSVTFENLFLLSGVLRSVHDDAGPRRELGLPAFGTAVSRFAYTTPLTLRMSFGVRF